MFFESEGFILLTKVFALLLAPDSSVTYSGHDLIPVLPLTALQLEPSFSIPTSLKVEEVVLANGFLGSVLSDYFWYVFILLPSQL